MEELGVEADEWKLMTLSIGANDVVSQPRRHRIREPG